jgi:FAD/FMN-containing dehydrogenase
VTKQPVKQQVIDSLRLLLGNEAVHTDRESLLHYGRDWTRMHEPAPAAIVFPTSTAQVKELVLLANRQGVGLVPSGGRTGLSGGAMAFSGEVVVSFERMNQIRDFNAIDRTVVCQAGVVTQDLQRFAQQQGLYYPVNFASSGSSQIGGNIATNAGGIKVIRYGLTRDWVAGLKVVTGKGDILELNKGLVKNATGFDLRHLFIGSEGTLGFITEATMRLTQPPQKLTVMVLAVNNFDALMPVLEHFQQAIELTAFEFFSDKALHYVLAEGDVKKPMATRTPCYALLEFEAVSEELVNRMMAAFEHCMERGWVLDGVMSQSDKQAEDLWRLREDISQSLAAFTPYKNDLSVTVSRVPEFLLQVELVVSKHYPDFDIIWYGHIGDGNLHLNILKPAGMEKQAFFANCARVSEEIFEIVGRMGGSISAEHGVGLAKKAALTYSRSESEVAYLRGMKEVFDPNGVMNPGKLFD